MNTQNTFVNPALNEQNISSHPINNDKQTTHFGFNTVNSAEKINKVAEIFNNVANKYDVMNDAMSVGMHRLWKKSLILHSGAQKHHKILDIAGGTGDITLEFYKKLGKNIDIYLTDINEAMLAEGKKRLQNKGYLPKTMVCNCEALPFDTKQFDIVTAAFGVRNMTDQLKAMQEVYRVLNYGGKALILEFSQPIDCIKSVYDFYSFNIIPKLGKLIANDEASYQYLVESIRMHPNQEAFSDILKQAGFSSVKYINLSLGIVALHIAYK